MSLCAAMASLAGCRGNDPAATTEGADEIEVAHGALVASDIDGTWFLNANKARISATISGSGPFTGFVTNEVGAHETMDNIAINGSFLEFRRVTGSFSQWYRLMLNQGVVAGRFSQSTATGKPALSQFVFHATGWRQDLFPGLPLAWDLVVNNGVLARVRIDQDSASNLIGEMKVYSANAGAGAGGASEERQFDLTNVSWDGTTLKFTRNLPGEPQAYTGTVSGRTIQGTFTDSGSTFPFSGTRAEVLSYGLGRRWTAASSQTRLARLRSRLMTLMMAGNPVGTETSATRTATTVQPMPTIPPDRDDDVANGHNPQNYTVDQWSKTFSLTNAFDGSAATRTIHGFITRPTTAAPAGGYRLVIAVNGHGGSAFQDMNPSNALFWYGDGYARRNFVVVSVDISHRTPGDTPLYNFDPNNLDGFAQGDDQAHGNGTHPSIKNSTGGTDWEEDGERTWDVMRAVDFALAQPNVNASHVLITGISLGGEVATITAAMDPRIGMAVAAGYSPDLSVIFHLGNHPCWQWAFADIREYIDMSDFEDLIAPRPLVVETGKQDNTFSVVSPFFAGDKQVLRRTAGAYLDQTVSGSLVHYLHYDFHRYHMGDKRPGDVTGLGVQGVAIGPPNTQSNAWETDGTTTTVAPTLFSLIQTLFP